MKTLIYILLVIGFLGIPNLTAKDAEDAKVLIIDLTKTLPGNPYQEEYERMLYPTVRIKTLFSTGSGVIIGDYILTAAHVVDAESTVIIELFYPDNIEIEASVIITDTTRDLALLTTDKHRLTQVYSAKLASKDYKPYIFAPVYTIGCSLGLIPRPSSGIITYIGDDLRPSASYWEISSPILPGNSGGPVFDSKTFEVIGIAVWIHKYNNQLITTMGGIVPIQEIYGFLQSAGVIYGRHLDTDIKGQDADTPPAD